MMLDPEGHNHVTALRQGDISRHWLEPAASFASVSIQVCPYRRLAAQWEDDARRDARTYRICMSARGQEEVAHL